MRYIPLANTKRLAWQNRRQFATPPLVSSRNEVWEKSAEIRHWWCVTTQIWIVYLIGWLRSFLIRHFARKRKVASRNVGSFLKLPKGLSYSIEQKKLGLKHYLFLVQKTINICDYIKFQRPTTCWDILCHGRTLNGHVLLQWYRGRKNDPEVWARYDWSDIHLFHSTPGSDDRIKRVYEWNRKPSKYKCQVFFNGKALRGSKRKIIQLHEEHNATQISNVHQLGQVNRSQFKCVAEEVD